MNGDAVFLEEVSNSLVRMPKGKLLVAKGLDDYIIVYEEEVLMIYPKSKEQEVKAVTQILKEKKAEYV